ncbi:unnamed protein product, partial [Sphacelaria rigidula]
KRIGDKGKNLKCITPGCEGHSTDEWGLCNPCSHSYRERLGERRKEARAMERHLVANPQPCRACEGLLMDSPHGESIRRANEQAAANAGLVASGGHPPRGTCNVCQQQGGKGPSNQLLLCDGQSCPVSTHMGCLKTPLLKVCGIFLV